MFRAYYLCGGLLTAALLGTGSLLGIGVRIAGPIALVYTGLAAGVALGVPIEGTIAGTSIPEAQEHLEPLPRAGACDRRQRRGVAGADRGRRRGRCAVARSATCCCLAGFAVAAAGSALAGLGAAQTAVFVAVGAGLLYAGTVVRM